MQTRLCWACNRSKNEEKNENDIAWIYKDARKEKNVFFYNPRDGLDSRILN